MPYVGLLPKSGCSAVAPEPLISAMYAADRDETGVLRDVGVPRVVRGEHRAPTDLRYRRSVVLPQVEASVRSAAPIAKWESRVGTRGYRHSAPMSGGSRLERGQRVASYHSRPVTTILGFIPSPSKGILHLGPLPLHAYGLCLALGVLVAVGIAERRWEARGGRAGTIGEIGVIVVVSGVIGARVYHLFTGYDWNAGGLAGTFKIWKGGLSIWGAVAGGALAVVIIAHRRKLPTLLLLDAIAPGVVMAQAIGRFGNYFNQELFGRPTRLPWGLEIDLAAPPGAIRPLRDVSPDLSLRVAVVPRDLRSDHLGRTPVQARDRADVRAVRHALHVRALLLRADAERSRVGALRRALQRVAERGALRVRRRVVRHARPA